MEYLLFKIKYLFKGNSLPLLTHLWLSSFLGWGDGTPPGADGQRGGETWWALDVAISSYS